MSNPLSWNQALAQGCNPRDYSYDKKDIPIGEYCAVLDFKIWSNKVAGINCYFCKKDSNQRFQLTIYRTHDDEKYRINDFDFYDCPIAKEYQLFIEINSKGNVKFSKIVPT